MDPLTGQVIRVLAILTLITLILYRRYIRDAQFISTVDKIPGPSKLPIVGCVFTYFEGRHDIMDFILHQMPKKFGPIIRFWVFGKAQIVVNSPRGIEPILKSTVFNIKSDNYDLLRESMGNGLVVSTDPHWSLHRKVLNPTFHIGNLQEYIPIFVKNANKMCGIFSKASVEGGSKGFDILPIFGNCALDIIGETAMGVEMNTQSNQNREYAEAVNRSNLLTAERYVNIFLRIKPYYFFSATKREHERILKWGRDFSRTVIAERRKILQDEDKIIENNKKNKLNQIEGQKIRRSLLDAMLVAEKDGVLTEEDILDEVTTFISAGYDTVSASSSYMLFMIATYPEVQEKVVAELEEVFGDSGRIPTMADVSKLNYLERVMKETLRIYPPVGVFERYVNQDVQCDQYLIPTGCNVSITPYVVHRDPEFWPDPEKFDPDRFLPELCEKRYPYSYIPFSLGHRNCIGQKFAMTEEKVLLSTVLRRFKVEAAQTRESLKLELSVVMRPTHGMLIRISDRDDMPNLRVTEQQD